MPRSASRLTLEITGVRVERLNSISEEDTGAEGINIDEPCPYEHRVYGAYGPGHDSMCYVEGDCRNPERLCDTDVTERFASLWDSINGKRPGCSWENNPWVWAVEFKRVE